MKIIKINNRLGLIANDKDFKRNKFFHLKPGDNITQIGDGRETGTNRTDEFCYPVQYAGSVELQFDKKETMYAFKVKNNEPDGNIYLLYGSTGKEIFTETQSIFGNNHIRFYKPKFNSNENKF